MEQREEVLERVKRYVLGLNGPATNAPDPEAVRTAISAIDNDENHLELLAILFHFLKSPSGDPVGPLSNQAYTDNQRSVGASLHRLVDINEPFTPHLAHSALRNWFGLVNAVIAGAVGSESRLRFKYSTLAPLGVVCFHLPRWQPAFMARCCDYLQSWRRRLVFDQEAMEILTTAYRGEPRAIEKAIGHADAQIASHFISLREGFLKRMNPESGSSSAEGSGDNIMPSYLYELMSTWHSNSEGPTGDVSERVGEVTGWYRSVVGEKLVGSIQAGRSEIESKYQPLLAKFRSLDASELERSRGQVMVLLKREFKRRAELMDEELQLVSVLDSRHALLTRKYDIFARLKWCLDRLRN